LEEGQELELTYAAKHHFKSTRPFPNRATARERDWFARAVPDRVSFTYRAKSRARIPI
jgi:hypothetical protein